VAIQKARSSRLGGAGRPGFSSSTAGLVARGLGGTACALLVTGLLKERRVKSRQYNKDKERI
jgi:hypothetical protein